MLNCIAFRQFEEGVGEGDVVGSGQRMKNPLLAEGQGVGLYILLIN